MRRESAFTLVELLAVMAVAAVLLTIGVPSLRVLIQNSRLVTEVNGIVAHINLARSEAIKRRATVSLCHSADANAEEPACAADQTDWAGGKGSGLLVFVDDNGDGVLDAGETLIRRGPREAGGLSVGAAGAPLRFRPDGSLNTVVIARFGVCDERGSEHRSARWLEVGLVGRPATYRGPRSELPESAAPDEYDGLCPD
jgi:type IV fimbrial biogenesis protein FimT